MRRFFADRMRFSWYTGHIITKSGPQRALRGREKKKNGVEESMLYSELQCSEAIHKAVERMGFAEMTEIQEKTIPVMLAGRDVIAKAPTGTGKTCAFGIPVAEHIDAALKAPQAVIMAPTRELAQQIAEELTALTYFMPEVEVACVYGGANMEKQAKRLAEGCQIVVATPGRLMDHYKHHSIDISHVTQIVLDEADEMLNMGFYKDVRHIIEMMKARKALSMFSATISREVMDIGWLYQHNAAEVSVQPVEDSSPKIAQYKLLTTGRDKLADAAQIIISEGYKRVMIFCNTKYNTGMLANQLARLNFNVDCLHGDLSQAERNRIMTRFKAGEISVLVATDVAARGIDVSDVDAVINYDVPEENEHYTHRIGRTGRARKQGASYLFYTKDEQKRVDQLLRLTRNTDDCKSVKFDFNHEKLTAFEDSGFVNFNFVNGGMGSLSYSTAVWNKNMESSMLIVAENGSVKIGGQYMNEVEYCHIKDYEMPELAPTNPGNDYGPYKGSAQNHNFVIRNVVNVLSGAPGEIITTNVLEGMKVVDIIQRIYASS